MKTPRRNFVTRSSWTMIGALALCANAAHSARAVTLEQKWLAGQQLSYDMNLNGTLTLDTPAGAPVLWAGMPLDVDVVGSGEIALDTRQVDQNGAGTVALKLPNIKIAGSAWEQKAVLEVVNGQPNFSFNGKTMNGARDKQPNLQFLVEPPYGLQISKTGHIERAVLLKPDADKANAKTPDANGAAVNGAVSGANTGGVPINVAGLIRSAFFQMLPAPWPDHAVAVGDTWTIVSRLPIPAAKSDAKDDAKNDGTANATPKPAFEVLELGKFDMTLKGEEDLAGHKAMRVGVVGALNLDAAKAAQLNRALNAQGNKLTAMTQKVSGDLWFDAEAGRLVKAALNLKGQVKTVASQPAKDGGAAKSWNSTQSFSGNLNFKLKNVAMFAAAPAAAPAAP